MARASRTRVGSVGRQRSFVRVVLVALLLGVFGLSLGTSDAGAWRTWCRSDPVVSIDGQLVDISVGIPPDQLFSVTGATQIVVKVPPKVSAELVVNDPAHGYPNEVSFRTSKRLDKTNRGIEVRIEVYVTASDDAMPVEVRVTPQVESLATPVVIEATANEWIVVRALV